MPFEHTDHITRYYDEDGNLVRVLTNEEVTGNGKYEGYGVYDAHYARIGDTDYFAVITTKHFVNVSDHNRVFDDTWYSVVIGDLRYDVDVDEEGNLVWPDGGVYGEE